MRTITEALAPYAAKAIPKPKPEWPCVKGLSFDDCHKRHRWVDCPGSTMTWAGWLPAFNAHWNFGN